MRSLFQALIFLGVLCFSSITLLAQEQDKELSKQLVDIAIEVLGTGAMDDARDQMVQAANFDTTNLRANFEAGHLHILTINKHLAVQFFMRVYRQRPTYRFDLEYWIGNSYHYAMEFDKAIDYYTRYRNKAAAQPNYSGRDFTPLAEVDKEIQECKNGKVFLANPKNHSIKNIGREINSEYEDYAPTLNADETEIVFTSRRRDGNLNENVAPDNKPFEDIFFAKRKGDRWDYAKNIGDHINTPSFDSNLALSPDDKLLFIYKPEGDGDIYFCERQADGTWGEPEPLPGIINSTFRESSISITEDEKTLYFASDRPGGYGGSDIYVCTKDNRGQWSKVKNLGPKVNTPYDEDGPYIDADNKTLFFASQGGKGMGGFDIYRTVLQDAKTNEWSEPENLGYPINTPDDDVYFVGTKSGKKWYYSSLREDGMGYTDIYEITVDEQPKKEEPVIAKEEPKKEEPKKEEPKKEEPVIVKEEPKQEEPKKEELKKEVPKKEEPKKVLQPLKYLVRVIDAETKTELDSKVRLVGQKDNVVVGSSQVSVGNYEFTITINTAKDYRLSAEREGYAFVNQNLKIEGASTEPKTITKVVELRKLVVGVSSVLRNIYFDFGKATFKTESYNELNKLESMMKQNPNLKVEISGHTDSVGKDAFNKQLSQLRANAVKSFLTSKGIDTRRVKAVGYGEERPLASNDDELEGRQYNRRVEFKVLGN